MNRNRELAINTVILAFGKICTQFISFFLLPLYTALLTPEEMGIVDLFNTYIQLLVPVFNCQLDNGLFRFMIEARDNQKQQKIVFSTVFFANLGQIVLYLVFAVIAFPFMTSSYRLFLVINIPISILLNTLLQLPRGLGKNMVYAVASFISAVSAVVLNVIFIAGLGMGADGMFISTIVSQILAVLFLAFALKIWEYIDITSFNIPKLKSMLKYSVPLIPNQLSWWVISTSDRVIISVILGVAVNGIYSVANKFSSICITLYNLFNLSWTESVSLHIDDDDAEAFFSETINTLFKLFTTVCIGVIAVMPFCFNILVDKEYNKAYNQIPILLLAVIFQIIVGLYSTIYVAKKDSKQIAKTSMFAAVINITVNFVLINKIELYAASVSTLVAYFAMAVYRYMDVKKYIDIPLKKTTVISIVAVGIIVIVAYYYNRVWANIVSFVIVLVFAIIINKNFIISVKNILKNRSVKRK